MLDNKRTICINYDKEAASSDRVKAYTKLFFEVNGENEDKIRYVWAELTIHILIEILEKISCTQREAEELDFLQPNGKLSRKLYINGLYILNEINIQNMALHPNARQQFPFITAVSIPCHIRCDIDCSQISIDFFYANLNENLNTFCDVFNKNIIKILDHYYAKCMHYYFCLPQTEITIVNDQIPEDTRAYRTMDRTAILVDKKEIRFRISKESLKNLKWYLGKFKKPTQSESNINARKTSIIWCKMCVDFIKDIFTKIFAFQLQAQIDPLTNEDLHISPCFHVYNATGYYDLLYKRCSVPTGFNQGGELLRQIKKTLVILKQNAKQYHVPLRLIINVWYDTINYDFVVIDMYNLNEVHHWQDDAFPGFFESIKKMIPKLIDHYFDLIAKGYLIMDKHVCFSHP